MWRKTFPNRKQYTWRQLSLKIYSRLDYWLISSAVYPYIKSVDIKPVINCDHNAVSIKLKVKSKKRGKGYWKFNNSLLKDEVYKSNIQNIIRKVNTEFKFFDKRMKWEMCKIKIKEFSMKYSIDVEKNRKKYIVNLENEYKELSKELDNNSCTNNIEKIKNVKKKIDKWYEHQCKGAFVRSRARWLEFGEKSTKYFLQLEKAKGKKKEVDCLEVNGQIIKDEDKIMSCIQLFYTKLYEKSKATCDFQNYISDIKLNVLSDDDAILCEGKLTENECLEALKAMNLNKSPGSDGLSVEFYRCFWQYIKHMVIDSLNEGYDKQELSYTQSQAILTLLYKKGNKNYF